MWGRNKEICGAENGTGRGFSKSTSVLFHQCFLAIHIYGRTRKHKTKTMRFRVSAVVVKKSILTFFVLQGRAMAEVGSRLHATRRHGFDLQLVCVVFVVAKVARISVSLRVLHFDHLIIVTLMLHT